MNIQEASTQIERAIRIYLKKDDNGHYRIPLSRQRPIFLIGAPGIGKTAIMAQIAARLGIALVSYSMTHHTRQSALGLPFIKEKTYNGEQVSISEYTMSEIIATIYDTIEQSGMTEGILFLDEINCVSETLAPAMLQFLQYKVFGRHRVPPGWVIVTAGNPPAYNRTVREFDIATLDRLRVLEVEEDYTVWRSYAKAHGVHGAILGFLDLKKSYFYHIETTVDGKRYVTARGWEDLSDTLRLYEEENLPVDRNLIDPIIRQPKIAREFSAYYDLYTLYERTYSIPDILTGNVSNEVLTRAKSAPFDERLSLIGLLTGAVQKDCRNYCLEAATLAHLQHLLGDAREDFALSDARPDDLIASLIEKENTWLTHHRAANHLQNDDYFVHRNSRDWLLHFVNDLDLPHLSGSETFAVIRDHFNNRAARWDRSADTIAKRIHHLFSFAERAFPESDALLIIATELSVGVHSATYLAERGHPDYEQHKHHLALERRETDLLKRVEAIGL